jgi:hypothetical protein
LTSDRCSFENIDRAVRAGYTVVEVREADQLRRAPGGGRVDRGRAAGSWVVAMDARRKIAGMTETDLSEVGEASVNPEARYERGLGPFRLLAAAGDPFYVYQRCLLRTP